jgi:hypothetical protein
VRLIESSKTVILLLALCLICLHLPGVFADQLIGSNTDPVPIVGIDGCQGFPVSVPFRPASSELTQSGNVVLEALANEWRRARGFVLIAGQGDPKEIADQIDLRRAEATRDNLIGLGVGPYSIRIQRDDAPLPPGTSTIDFPYKYTSDVILTNSRIDCLAERKGLGLNGLYAIA